MATPDYVPSQYQPTIAAIIAREGGYSNNPADSGGETIYGVTAAVWRANGYVGLIKDAPRWLAEKIYFRRYITDPQFNLIHEINSKVGEELIDTGVNMGVIPAGRMLQRALNALNADNRYGQPLPLIGTCGPNTRHVLQNYLIHRPAGGDEVLLAVLNGLQATRYVELTEAKASQKQFFFGWIRGRVL